jgi:hypothetical protein
MTNQRIELYENASQEAQALIQREFAIESDMSIADHLVRQGLIKAEFPFPDAHTTALQIVFGFRAKVEGMDDG